MQSNKENVIVDMSFEFAVQILEFCDVLYEAKKFHVSNQLLKAGTSIGANVREAQNAESIADFIHKMKIAAKEADETQYWLLLCKFAKSYPESEKLLEDIEPIIKVLSKIISSSKAKK